MDTSSVVSMDTIRSTKSFGPDDIPSCPRCWFQLLTIVTMIKAVIARLIFGIHSFVAIWRVTDVKGPVYWCLALALMVLMIEGVMTIWKKKGAEWKWFSPVVFFYLCSVVPAIWFLELDILEKRLHNRNLVESGKPSALNLSRSVQSQTSSEGLSMIRGVGIYIPIQLKAEDWTKVLEQLLLLFLIVGRWLLPKGDITRDQLSQLLLIYRIAVVITERGQQKRDKEKEREDTEIMTLSHSESNLKSRTARHSHPAIRKSKSFAGLQKTNSINEMSNKTKPARSYPAIPNSSFSRPGFTEYADELYPRPLLRPRYPNEFQLLPARNELSDMATQDSYSSGEISRHSSLERNSFRKDFLHESLRRNSFIQSPKIDSFQDSDRWNSIREATKQNSLHDNIVMCEKDTFPLAANVELSNV
ncbi:uncharacterized protein LOC135496996 [Lineus longissimus]|uniref:uncharacterized protein LOC135496996 n=1 Tax=Lineus longissimus TaxID=88925 RepID=UPI00315D6073